MKIDQAQVLIPGVGWGPLRYGFSQNQVLSILGLPEDISEVEYIPKTGDWNRCFQYLEGRLELHFDQEDDFRLGGITLYDPDLYLLKQRLHQASKQEVRDLLKRQGYAAPDWEDQSAVGQTHELLDSQDTGIFFWFDNDQLSEVQANYLFEGDGDTIIWPHPSRNYIKDVIQG